MILDLIGATTTKAGLTVRFELNSNVYPKGVAIFDAGMWTINLVRDDFHGEGNYTIRPTNRSDQAFNS